MTSPSFLMPFPHTECHIWYAHESEADAYGNTNVTYNDEPDWEGECVYAPGRTNYAQTTVDHEDGRPYGAEVKLTVFLPKTFDNSLRQALIAVYPSSDSALSGKIFKVYGEPFSYMREATPGDFSWIVEAVDYVG